MLSQVEWMSFTHIDIFGYYYLFDMLFFSWSAGVIAFVCLSGFAPFDGKDDVEVMAAVSDGYYDFEDEAWDDISDDAMDFIKHLLAYKEEDRYSAAEALQHPWLRNIRRRASVLPGRRESSRMSLACMKQFQAHSKLKQAVCSLIASQLLKKEEKDEIDKAFRTLDLDCGTFNCFILSCFLSIGTSIT